MRTFYRNLNIQIFQKFHYSRNPKSSNLFSKLFETKKIAKISQLYQSSYHPVLHMICCHKIINILLLIFMFLFNLHLLPNQNFNFSIPFYIKTTPYFANELLNNSFILSDNNRMIEEDIKNPYFNSTDRIDVQLLPAINVEILLDQRCPQLLSKEFRKKYKKELSTYIFMFDVSYRNKKWSLKRRFNQFLEFSSLLKKKYGRETPGLPLLKESEVTPSNIDYFGDFLIIFLRKAIEIGQADDDVRHFFELMPQKYGSSIIHAEVRLKKLSGGRHTEATCQAKFRRLFCDCCRNWRKRYFTVTDECVFYTINKKSYEIKQMLPFTVNFKVLYGRLETGEDLGRIIQSSYRTLQLKAEDLYDFSIFISAILESLQKSIYCVSQRYNSFASVRTDCSSKFYIDGSDYFSDVCDEMMKAERHIYITDWMLTPYFQLKRPAEMDDTSCRLDYVLGAAAQKGVKVNIILFMEPKIALNNDSEFVESYLTQMHKNIKVLRHPNYILVPFLWSHHEKMVIIDQKCAFMGGLDLCYGRWDNQKHTLHNNDKLWKGADYCNFRISDIYQPRNFIRSNLNEHLQPRMPWHDIAIQIRGSSVLDITRHFVQYWNFVSFQTKFNERELLMHSGHQASRKSGFFWSREQSSKDMTSREIQLKQDLFSDEIEVEEQEKEYYQKFLQTSFKRLIEFPNINLNQLKKVPKKLLQYLKDGEDGNEERLMFDNQQNQTKKETGWQEHHQILRSASTWSLGFQPKQYERSIYQAYLDLIRNAEEFIYIQNQFFICKKNKIIEVLAEKILRCHRENKKFKVIIMLPLLPGFEGDVADDSSAVMRVQLNWEYVTLSRSKFSLFARLESIPNISDYVQVLSLRNHALLDKEHPITQILYIHSKLMIVDDRKVILGSANINDRSLLGKRDSQIAILVEQSRMIETSTGRKVAPSAHKLRCNLFEEHFNITYNQAEDFFNQETWELIGKKAKKNTEMYRKIFGCYPDDTMKTYKDIALRKEEAELHRYEELSAVIDGFVVEFPTCFLQKEDLALRPSQKQFFVPDINFC